jgi:hypothetical protein
MGNEESAFYRDPGIFEHADLFAKGHRIDNDSITDDANAIFMEYSAWDKVEDEFPAVGEFDRMSGIRTALVSGYNVCAGSKEIDNFSFSFITPLRAEHNCYRHTPCTLINV